MAGQLGMDGAGSFRKPSVPFSHHASSLSTSTLYSDNQSTYKYAPSTYAQSTIAASTIMPNFIVQPVRSSASTAWVEGHCLQWQATDDKTICSVCEEKADDGIYICNGKTAWIRGLQQWDTNRNEGCDMTAHGRCAEQICLVCPIAFHPDQIQAAFVRCFASLFYTYRKFLYPAIGDQKVAGKIYRFNMDGFLKSIPRESANYVQMLQQTQGESHSEQGWFSCC